MLGNLFDQGDQYESSAATDNVNEGPKIKKPPSSRGPSGFVGLDNQGATCYLNSLIQVMYMTPELRQGLFAVHTAELGANLSEYCGVEDASKRRKVRYIPLELQRLFSQLAICDLSSISTQELTSKGFQWENYDGQVQHDAHELNRLLIDALEKSLKKTSGETLCQRLYEGTVVNQIECNECHTLSERSESFYDLNMQIIQCSSIVDSLRHYCAGEILTGDSAYQCDRCQKKCTATRCSVLRTLPSILTFSCNRFKIDASTDWTRVKVTSKHEFPLLLNMSHYHESKNASIKQQLNPDSNKELEFMSQLKQNSGIWLHEMTEKATSMAIYMIEKYKNEEIQLQDLSDEDLLYILNDMVPQSFVNDNNLDSNSSSQQTISEYYRLHAVIMHRGSAFSGHYFAYIRDNLNEGQWDLDIDDYKTIKLTEEEYAKINNQNTNDANDNNNVNTTDNGGGVNGKDTSNTSSNISTNAQSVNEEEERIKAEIDRKLQQLEEKKQQIHYKRELLQKFESNHVMTRPRVSNYSNNSYQLSKNAMYVEDKTLHEIIIDESTPLGQIVYQLLLLYSNNSDNSNGNSTSTSSGNNGSKSHTRNSPQSSPHHNSNNKKTSAPALSSTQIYKAFEQLYHVTWSNFFGAISNDSLSNNSNDNHHHHHGNEDITYSIDEIIKKNRNILDVDKKMISLKQPIKKYILVSSYNYHLLSNQCDKTGNIIPVAPPKKKQEQESNDMMLLHDCIAHEEQQDEIKALQLSLERLHQQNNNVKSENTDNVTTNLTLNVTNMSINDVSKEIDNYNNNSNSLNNDNNDNKSNNASEKQQLQLQLHDGEYEWNEHNDDSVIDADEAFARALQQSFDEELQQKANNKKNNQQNHNNNKKIKNNSSNGSNDASEWRITGKRNVKQQKKNGSKFAHNSTSNNNNNNGAITKKVSFDNIAVDFKENKDLNNHNGSNNNIGSNKSTATSSNGSNNKDKFMSVPKSSKEKAIERLTHSILTHICGNYYEFNDSIVKPMAVKDLEKSFSGGDCAYLLVYRKIVHNNSDNIIGHSSKMDRILSLLDENSLFNSLFNQRLSQSKVTSSSVTIQVPEFWLARIKEMNEKLTQERMEYELQSHKITVNVYDWSRMIYTMPLFYPKHVHIKPLTIEIDGRNHIKDILSEYCNNSNNNNDEHSDKSNSSNTNKTKLNVTDLYITKLSKYGDGYYPDIYLSHESIISDTIHHQDTLMIWSSLYDDKHHEILVGPEHIPKKLVIQHLELERNMDSGNNSNTIIDSNTSVNKDKTLSSSSLSSPTTTISTTDVRSGGDVEFILENDSLFKSSIQQMKLKTIKIMNEKTNIYYLPSSMSLLTMCYYLTDKFVIDPFHASISMIETLKSNNEIVYSTSLLYDKGTIVSKTTPKLTPNTKNKNNNGSNNLSKNPWSSSHVTTDNDNNSFIVKESTTLGECGHILNTITIEDMESRGLSNMSLSEDYVMLKNIEWNLTIEIDNELNKILGNQHANSSNGNISSSNNTSSSEIVNTSTHNSTMSVTTGESTIDHSVSTNYKFLQLKVSKYNTIQELKDTIVDVLKIDTEKINVRLRSGVTKGEGLFENETRTLHEYYPTMIKDHSTLYVELGVNTAPQEIALQIILVNNNSTNIKYDQSTSGERVLEFEIIVSVKDTIQSLRDRLGVIYLNYPEGWSHNNELIKALMNSSNSNVNTSDASTNNIFDSDNNDLTQTATTTTIHEFKGRRLRKTSWLKEFADLLLETDDKGELITIQQSNLKSGDTLLFEEGFLPVKGQLSFTLYVWKNDPILLDNNSNTNNRDNNNNDSDRDSICSITGVHDDDIDASVINISTHDKNNEDNTNNSIQKDSNFVHNTTNNDTLNNNNDSNNSNNNSFDDPFYINQDLIDRVQKIRKSCLVPLGTIDVQDEITLTEFQSQIYQLLVQHQSELSQKITYFSEYLQNEDRFLIRELRSDYLPGKSYWTCAAPAGNNELNLNTIGVGSGGGRRNNNNPPGNNTNNNTNKRGVNHNTNTNISNNTNKNISAINSLKRLHMKTDKSLVIELLKDVQAKIRPPSGAFRIWLQRVVNPGAKEGEAIMAPVWPPDQLVVNTGTQPTLNHLKRQMSALYQQYYSDDFNRLRVYRYLNNSFHWTELTNHSKLLLSGGDALGTSGKTKKRSNNGSAATNGILKNEITYYLQEGDQFCCFEDFPPSPTTHNNNSNKKKNDNYISIDIALPEDMELRKKLNLERQKKQYERQQKQYYSFDFSKSNNNDSNKNGSGNSSGNGNNKKKEVGLSLGNGFDFSDDEEETIIW